MVWRVSCGTLLLLMCTLLVPGCAKTIEVHARALDCLNPPEMYCSETGDNSLILEFRIYQLKEYVDPASLDWGELLAQDADLDVLAPYLTDPSRPHIVRVKEHIRRREIRVFEVQRLKGTSHVLLVTVGRYPGAHSIDVAPVRRTQNHVVAEFDTYDVRLYQPTVMGQRVEAVSGSGGGE